MALVGGCYFFVHDRLWFKSVSFFFEWNAATWYLCSHPAKVSCYGFAGGESAK